jgi:hypothetical protein
MGIIQFIKSKRDFLMPDKERLVLFFSFLGFLPFPSYFIAGSGFVPIFYTAIVVLAFIIPQVSGLGMILILLYIASMPVLLYLIVSVLSEKVKGRYLKWGIALILILLACLTKVFYITDTAGVKTLYTAIELYGEIF